MKDILLELIARIYDPEILQFIKHYFLTFMGTIIISFNIFFSLYCKRLEHLEVRYTKFLNDVKELSEEKREALLKNLEKLVKDLPPELLELKKSHNQSEQNIKNKAKAEKVFIERDKRKHKKDVTDSETVEDDSNETANNNKNNDK